MRPLMWIAARTPDTINIPTAIPTFVRMGNTVVTLQSKLYIVTINGKSMRTESSVVNEANDQMEVLP